MSFFSSIGKALKSVAAPVLSAVSSFIPGVGGLVAGIGGAALKPKPSAAPAPMARPSWPTQPPPTTAGPSGGGILQTLPTLSTGGISGPGVPSPGGLMRSLGQAGSQFLQGAARGAAGSTISTKVGRLTGNYIPRGYVERMSSTGVVYLAKQRRRRGISARDISSFYRVNRLVSKIHGRAHRSPKRGK